jgi:FkbM family methyltransferase
MLAGSIAMNGHTNIFCHNYAVGRERGRIEIPQFDYNKPLNFGSIEFGGPQREKLEQDRRYAVEKTEYVEVVPLDAFGFARLDILKIDVEGMEEDVLIGAAETLRRCRPILYVEHAKSDRDALTRMIEGAGYDIHPIQTLNVLCIPAERRHQIRISDPA